MIHKISDSEPEQRSFYRLLHNPMFDIDSLKNFIYADCERQIEHGKHYLAIQDTTQPNFERNRKNIHNKDGLGVIGDGKSLGFFLHPTLIIGADDRRVLGFSNIETWSRLPTPLMDKEDKPRWEAMQRARPIEQKESMRWIRSANRSKTILNKASMITNICDREGDIRELFSRVPDEKTHLLVRSSSDRKVLVKQDGEQMETVFLFEHLCAQKEIGSYDLDVKEDPRIKRTGRVAKMIVRICPVILEGEGKLIPLYAVEAREDLSTVPIGEKAVHWRLLTTHEVTDLAKARIIIGYYAARWNIEQVFRTIKQKGFNVEQSDMETGKALIELTLMALLASVKVMLLHLSTKAEEEQPVKETFKQEELECLEALNEKFQGKTERQKNPYSDKTLQWCYWVIARMGGWKPSEKKAGVISLIRGYARFQRTFEGWMLWKESTV